MLSKKSLAALYGRRELAFQSARFTRLGEQASSEVRSGELRYYSSPGRTELGGNHTDHSGGRVLAAALRLDIAACVAPSGDRRVRLVSEGFPEPIVADLSDLEPRQRERGTPAALLRGVARGLADRGVAPAGFAGRLHSTIPPGSGLSSSAAVELLFGTILADLAGARIPPLELAAIAQRAENAFFGKPCGLMDQAAVALGGIVALDFADPDKPEARRVARGDDGRGWAIVVVNTGGSHADLTADYASIPAEMHAIAACLGLPSLRLAKPETLVERGPELRAACGDRALLRALHFAAENLRVGAMVRELERGDFERYLELVKRSGDSSWKLLQNLYPPSTPAAQGLSLALALSADYLGDRGACRVHGGGFAGTIQAYVPATRLAGYAALLERYFGPGCVIPVSIRPLGAARIS